MSESRQHLTLVKKIRDLIRSREGVTPLLVTAEDHEENTITFSTPEGFRPDVYYNDNNQLILGEAKTSNDISNGHSNAQFDSYLKYLSALAGTYEKVSLYVGVPWADYRTIKNKLIKMKPDSVSIIVVNDFGFEEEL